MSNTTWLFKLVADRWLTDRVPNGADQAEVRRNVDFMRSIGFEDFSAYAPRLNPAVFRGINLRYVEPNVILFPGASWTGRQWPAERFAQLAAWLQDTYRLKVLICGALNERALSQSIAASDERIIDLTGTTSLESLAAIFSRALLVVSNETSAVHLAAAVGTRSISITGGGHFGRFLPYPTKIESSDIGPTVVASRMPCFNCNWSCTYLPRHNPKPPAAPCIDRISLEQVKTITSQIIEPLLLSRHPHAAINE
jgi:ADP-heptose:LPS heptosyltransferase